MTKTDEVISKKLTNIRNNFLSANQKLANKYNCTVSIGQPGSMIEIASPKKKAGMIVKIP